MGRTPINKLLSTRSSSTRNPQSLLPDTVRRTPAAACGLNNTFDVVIGTLLSRSVRTLFALPPPSMKNSVRFVGDRRGIVIFIAAVIVARM